MYLDPTAETTGKAQKHANIYSRHFAKYFLFFRNVTKSVKSEKFAEITKGK